MSCDHDLWLWHMWPHCDIYVTITHDITLYPLLKSKIKKTKNKIEKKENKKKV